AKAPLGLLWYGGPSNDEVLPRHGHGPTPQVAAGRLFIEGADMLRALDIYTGRLLWQKRLPGLGTFFDVTGHQSGAGEIGSNYVSLEDAVYVVHGQTILELDPATGKTGRQLTLEPTADNPRPYWGYIGVWEDVLIATSTPVVPSEKKETPTSDDVSLIPPNAQWQYMAGSDPAGDWTAAGYAATDWKTGEAGFGYEDDDDRTVLSDMKDRYTRVYLRKTFDARSAADAERMTLKINYDDAFIAYLNGKEIVRTGVERGRGKDADGIIAHEAEGPETFAVEAFRSLLLPGKNVLAIEGHNHSADSSDFSLDPVLLIKKADHTARRWRAVRHGSASRRLVVFDRHLGKELWSRPAKYGFRHNTIAVGGGKLFCIDGISQAKRETLERFGKSTKDYAGRLLALDIRTGEEVW
ncbi:hypothetical protein LCGC14_2798970, partial [marine sediment metagenome]